jgi:hypothetical protein
MPLVVDVLVPILLAAIGVFLFSQCIVPASTGRLWFPVFRKRATLLRELERAREEQDDNAIQASIQNVSQGEKEHSDESNASESTQSTNIQDSGSSVCSDYSADSSRKPV